MLLNKKNILHYPQLDTVLMVEDFIRERSGEYRRKELWQHLPKKMMYQTFQVILAYLLESGKIIVANDGKVIWVWNPGLVRKYLKKKKLFWRQAK